MDKWLIIINPTAGGGRAVAYKSIIEENLDKHNIDYEILVTKKAREGTSIVKNSSHRTIVAVGGDGTVNELAKGILERGYGVLGIIPAGTGNDLSRSLGLPMDPVAAISILVEGNIGELDIGQINEEKFLNVASAGFDAEVVINTDKVKENIRGKMAYVLGVIMTLFNYRKRYARIEIDGITYNRKLVLLAVGNGQYYGGGMKILPNAKLNDGYLHLCLVKDANNLVLLLLFPTIFKGKHININKYVESFKAKEVKIELEENISINFDGEIRKNQKEILFKLSDKKLSIICKKT